MSPALRRVLGDPSLVALLVLCLVVAGLLGWYHGGREAWSEAWGQWQVDRASHWDSERWALTAEDFPGRGAAEIPVDREWLTETGRDRWAVAPSETPGLWPLFFQDRRWERNDDWSDGDAADAARGLDPFPVDASSGLQVDGVQVFAFVDTPDPGSYASESYAGAAAAPWVWGLLDDALAAPALLDDEYSWYHDWGDDRGRVLSVGYVGTEHSRDEVWERRSTALEDGEPGRFGVTTRQRGEDGEEFRATALATVVAGALVSVGVVVPDGVEPPADLEPELLLERLSDEVRADPPPA